MLTHDAVHVPAPVASIKFSCARARGRPAGQELVAQARGLRLHHLAIMRAVVHGMTPADAAKRYLPELQDLRVVRSELQIMTREACVHLDGLGEVGLAKALASVFHSDSEPETVSDESGPGAGAGAGAGAMNPKTARDDARRSSMQQQRTGRRRRAASPR